MKYRVTPMAFAREAAAIEADGFAEIDGKLEFYVGDNKVAVFAPGSWANVVIDE